MRSITPLLYAAYPPDTCALAYTLYFVNFLTIQIVIIFPSMFEFTGTISFGSHHILLVCRDRVSWVIPPAPAP